MVKGVENTPQQGRKTVILTISTLPSLQQSNKANMPGVQKSRNIVVTMLGTTLAFAVLIGLTIAGVTSEQNLNKNNRKSSDLDEDIMADFEDESLSVVKRTAVPEAQRFRPRQRQLNNFSGGLKSSFSLSDIVNNEYSAERWNGTWISDVEFAYRNRQGDLAILR